MSQIDTTTANAEATEEFTGTVLDDVAGFIMTLLSAIGERHGLFRALADGPASSAELAERTGTDERYVREWLRAMAAAEYVVHDRSNGSYTLPAAHAGVLADENSPYFFGGPFQMVFGYLGIVERVAAAFREGGGAPQSAYGPDLWEGMARFTNGWFEHLLLADWLPAVPGVRRKLEQGARLADVGCGAGTGLIRLAREFPHARLTGYDVSPEQLELARTGIAQAGLADRVELRLADVSQGLSERYDVVTTFDVVHDAVDPLGLMRGIRAALEDDGSYLMLEIKSADDPADNVGVLPQFLYGASIFYCMTTSLARGGAGLGTCGMPEAKVRELGAQAGFDSVAVAPITENPFNVLYELRP
ncbi:MAG: methyltransferase domain-containing protein [Solirubrobacteraceae bacterium]|nr:methyltransferase domain-containing protein [Solirubrobacteraceae bacterium]